MSKYWIPFTKQMGASEKQYYTSLSQGLDAQLKATSEWLSTEEARDIQYNNRNELKQYLQDSGLSKELKTIIQSNASSSKDYIQQFYEQGARKGCKDINRKLAFTSADKEALYNLKEYSFDLVTNLGNDLRESIRESLTDGIVQGSSIGELRKQIQELPLTPTKNGISPQNRARMIARTEYARARVNGALQSYENYGVDSVEIITAGDDYVCDICLDAEEKNPYDLNDKSIEFPPFHPNCRCTVAPVTSLSEYQNSPLSDPNVINLAPTTEENYVKESDKYYGFDEKVGTLIEDFYNNRSNNKIEYGQIIDLKTGKYLINKDIKGSKSKVKIPVNKKYGTDIMTIHNHCDGYSNMFSGTDIGTFLRYNAEQKACAVINKGEVFIAKLQESDKVNYLKESNGISRQSESVISYMNKLHRESLNETRKEYDSLIKNAKSQKEVNSLVNEANNKANNRYTEKVLFACENYEMHNPLYDLIKIERFRL